MESTILIPIIVVIVLIALAIFLHFVPMGLWISALASGVHIPISALTTMTTMTGIRMGQPIDISVPP